MIAHRYILVQMIKPLVAILVALNVLLLVVELLKVGEITFAAGLTFVDMWRTIVFFIPGFMIITGPITILLGILMGFARMSEDGELVALSACGFSPWKLAVVPMMLGSIFWGLTSYSATVLSPACARLLEKNFAGLAQRQVAASLKAGEFFEDIPRLVLFPAHSTSKPHVFRGFLLYDHRPGHVRHMLVASEARIVADKNTNRLDMHFFRGQVHARDKARGQYSVLDFQRAQVGIDIERVVKDRTRFLRPYEAMTMEQLSLAVKGDTKLSKTDRLDAASVFYRRFSFPASSLVFALLAIVIGLSGKLQSRRGTLIITGSIVVSYYLLVRFMDVLVRAGSMNPALAAWVPNIVVFVAAFWMMVRKGRIL